MSVYEKLCYAFIGATGIILALTFLVAFPVGMVIESWREHKRWDKWMTEKEAELMAEED